LRQEFAITEYEHVNEEWGAGIAMSVEDSQLTVLFEEVGYRTLAEILREHRGLLATTF